MAPQQTVLIIDDCSQDRQTFRHYLLADPEHHYTILEEASGKGALALCRELEVDCILLEYLLPDQDGLEFLAELKQQAMAMPAVIMLTRHGNEAIAVRAMKSGVQDYLVKGQTTAQVLHSTMQSARANVTEKKQAEKRLIELCRANKRFQLAAAAVNSVIYDWDVVHNTVERTEGLTQILGVSQSSIKPTSDWWIERIHPSDLQRTSDQVTAALAMGDRYTVEYRVRHKDGEYRYVLDQGIVVRDANGRIVRVVGTKTDISVSKLAEAKRQESETKFRRIVESNIVGIYFGDFSGRIAETNDAFLEMVGYTREDLETGIMRWDRMTPPEYQALDRQRIQELQSCGVCTPFEKEYIRKDGSRVPILVGIARMDGREEDGYSACFILDLTQRKQAEAALRQSEERYRYLSEAIPQIVWICNANGECEYLNQRWYEFTGQTVEQAMKLGWLNVVHPEDSQAVMEVWTDAMRTGELYETELRYRRGDGTYRWYLVRALPMKDELGRVLKWFGTSTDIDDRKQFEAERNRLLELEQVARAEAEAANHAKDEFVAMVSHDLRAPLNAILGWATMLLRSKLDEATITRALVTIERNAKSQAKLLEDLLDISRILQGNLKLEIYQINLVSTIKAAMETAYPSANAKTILLVSVLDDSIPPIMGDPNRLQQVLGNLFSNAIKFTPESGKVEVRLHQNDNFAQITVSDTGIGISPEFLPYIFERYHQADSTKRQGGLGLGLAIARHLVELHGGTIEVVSPGVAQGTTFTIKLPFFSRH